MEGGRQVHVVVPAAGLSRRMGRPKLLLPLGGESVIVRLLKALRGECAGRIVVVARREDAELAGEVRSVPGVELVLPDIDPPDMRTSVECGLNHLMAANPPGIDDQWLLCPADTPNISPAVVKSLIETGRSLPGRIVIPVHGGRRGHPILLPWSLASAVFSLPNDVGLNSLIRDRAADVVEVEAETDAVLADLDTPDDYVKWRSRLGP